MQFSKQLVGTNMAIFKIPLISTNHRINVALGKTTYTLQFIYRVNKWFVDILDLTGEYLIAAIPMVIGDNLLGQHQHIIQGGLYVSNTNEDEAHRFSDLGQTIQLYWSE